MHDTVTIWMIHHLHTLEQGNLRAKIVSLSTNYLIFFFCFFSLSIPQLLDKHFHILLSSRSCSHCPGNRRKQTPRTDCSWRWKNSAGSRRDKFPQPSVVCKDCILVHLPAAIAMELNETTTFKLIQKRGKSYPRSNRGETLQSEVIQKILTFNSGCIKNTHSFINLRLRGSKMEFLIKKTV